MKKERKKERERERGSERERKKERERRDTHKQIISKSKKYDKYMKHKY